MVKKYNASNRAWPFLVISLGAHALFGAAILIYANHSAPKPASDEKANPPIAATLIIGFPKLTVTNTNELASEVLPGPQATTEISHQPQSQTLKPPQPTPEASTKTSLPNYTENVKNDAGINVLHSTQKFLNALHNNKLQEEARELKSQSPSAFRPKITTPTTKKFSDGMELLNSRTDSATYKVNGLFGDQCVTKKGDDPVNAFNTAVHSCGDNKLTEAYDIAMKKRGLH
ncbi:hypothetical protein AltI4_13690 [Alteromonas sp. I4]|nr:hypothetical protein AltI4_13690 [Alteromonas sp. I4]